DLGGPPGGVPGGPLAVRQRRAAARVFDPRGPVPPLRPGAARAGPDRPGATPGGRPAGAGAAAQRARAGRRRAGEAPGAVPSGPPRGAATPPPGADPPGDRRPHRAARGQRPPHAAAAGPATRLRPRRRRVVTWPPPLTPGSWTRWPSGSPRRCAVVGRRGSRPSPRVTLPATPA